MRITIIAAMSKNNVIGINNTLPWHLPDELKHFKLLTRNTTMLMGRNTFMSLPGILPGRPHWVLSRTGDGIPTDHPQVRHFFDDSEAINTARQEGVETLMIIGGAQIYAQLLHRATDLYLTQVDATIQGDAYFPAVDVNQWSRLSQQDYSADERHAYGFSCRHYVSKNNNKKNK